MSKKISISIAKSKLKPEWFTHHKNGETYINLDCWENEQPNKFGDHYSVKQAVPKEHYKKGMKTDYVGNGKVFEFGGEQRQSPQPQAQQDDDNW